MPKQRNNNNKWSYSQRSCAYSSLMSAELVSIEDSAVFERQKLKNASEWICPIEETVLGAASLGTRIFLRYCWNNNWPDDKRIHRKAWWDRQQFYSWRRHLVVIHLAYSLSLAVGFSLFYDFQSFPKPPTLVGGHLSLWNFWHSITQLHSSSRFCDTITKLWIHKFIRRHQFSIWTAKITKIP